MSTYLLCASPIQGHAAPVIAIARDLVSRGHDVTVLTGSRFRSAVEAAGARHVALTGVADYDDRKMQDHLPERDRRIVFLRYFEERTQSEIAEAVGVSQVHVSRLLRDAVTRLRGDLPGGPDVSVAGH